MPSSRARIAVNPKLIFQQAESGAVLVDSGTGDCFELNYLAADIWKRLLAGNSEEEIVAALAAAHSVPSSTVESDLRNLLAELSRNGLLRITT